MGETNSEPIAIDRSELDEVEQKLGLQILGEGASFMPDHMTDDEERADVRHVLFTAGAAALAEGAEAADIRNEPKFKTVRWLQSQVHIAQNLRDAAFGQYVGDAKDKRADFQGKLMRGIYEHAQTVPVSYRKAVAGGESVVMSDNLLVVSPTGTGKTVVEAKLLHAAGVGSADRRGLLVVPDQALHRQYRGDSGDNTFRRWFGEDTEISSYWQYEKQGGAPLQIVTKQSLEAAIEANILDVSDIDMVIVDEGHVGLEPKMMQRLNDFARVYYFTATPAYSLERDLRKLFRHVEVGTITDCIYEGIVNDVEIYTFKTKNKAEAEILAAQLAYNDVQDERQVVVYCHPGGRAKQAGEVASRINDLQAKNKPDNRDAPIAQRVSAYEPNSEETIRRYETGETRVITTVNMLGQGYNGNINTAIILGAKTSLLQLVQRIGRALRPNEQFRTRLIEILYEDKETVTIWNALGLDEVQQGRILEPQPSEWLPPIGGETIRPPQKSLLETMSEEARELLVPNQPVSKIQLTKNMYEAMTAMEQGFVSAETLAEQGNVAVRRIHTALDREGYHYVGIWTPDAEETTKYVRWYEPAAIAYLAENPIPPDYGDEELTIYGLMDLFDVSKDTIMLILQKYDIEAVQRIGKSKKVSNYYTAEAIERIGSHIQSIPVAAEEDVTVGMLKQELGEKFILRCFKEPERFGEPVYKRRFAGHGFKGFDFHLTRMQAETIRQAFKDAIATDDDISFLEIAALAGVTPAAINHGVTQEEKAQATLKRATPISRTGYHLPRAVGLKTVERFMVRPLPAHLVPLKVLSQRVNINTSTIRKAVKEEMQQPNSGIELINLGGTNAASTCVPWAILERLEEKYGRREGVTAVDFTKVPKNKTEVTFDQWRYSTQIQAEYVDPAKLSVAPDDTWQESAKLTERLNCTPGALSVLAALAGASKSDIGVVNGVMYLNAELVRRVKIVRNRYYVAHEDWMSLQHVVNQSEFTAEEFAWALKAADVSSSERRLGLGPNGTLDICYNRSTIRKVIQTLQITRRADV